MTYAPTSAAHRSMANYFPEWTVDNLPERSNSPQCLDPAPGLGDTYSQFLLGSNWILRPDGLKEFYEKLEQHFPNHEVIYNAQEGYFRVRCAMGQTEGLVTLIRDIITEIMHSESENISIESDALVTTTNSKLRYIREWRRNPPDAKELAAYERFSYPREISVVPFRFTWKIPKEEAGKGLTIQKLFVVPTTKKLLAKSTGCLVIEDADDISLHLGAESEEQIAWATRKMDTILKYYNLNSQIGEVQRHLLYTELYGNPVELRYLAHISKRCVATVILDPSRYQPSKVYAKLLEVGCSVRSTISAGRAWKSMEANRSPAVPKDRVLLPFAPFSDWKFPEREAQCDPEDQVAAPAAEPISLNVNPQAAPLVLEWATKVPPFDSVSMTQVDKKATSASKEAMQSPRDHPPQGNLSGTPILSPEVEPSYTTERTHKSSNIESLGSFNAKTSCVPRDQPSNMAPEREREAISRPTPSNIAPQGASDRNYAFLASLEERDKDPQAHAMPPESLRGIADVNQTGTTDSAPTVSKGVVRIEFDHDLFGEEFDPDKAPATGETHQKVIDLLDTPLEELYSVDAPLLPLPLAPQLQVMHAEHEYSQYFRTMRQQGARRNQSGSPSKKRGANQQAPNMAIKAKVYDSLSQMLEPLRFYSGEVTLKAEICRIWFTKIDWHVVSTPKRSCLRTVEEMEELLTAHLSSRDLHLTRIISVLSGDANYMVNMKENNAQESRLWSGVDKRAFYDFWCVARGEGELDRGQYVVLEVDAADFSYKLRKADTKASNVFVHCTRRDFDFLLVAEGFQDLEPSCGGFASDVVKSLHVEPRPGGAPHLEYTVFKDWDVEIMGVQIRQVAKLAAEDNTSHLHVAKVQRMTQRVIKRSSHMWSFAADAEELVRSRDGHFSFWYEAYITSTKTEKAFRQNRELEFGDEANWTPQTLKESGAFDDLLRAATRTVRHMDGVAYWCDNHQGEASRAAPPLTEKQKFQREKEQKEEESSFW